MYFWAGIWKYYCHVSNHVPQICLVPKFGVKKKSKKKSKDQKFLIWVFLGWNLKNCCHIWNQHPQTCLIANFSKFGTQNVWLGIFGQEFEKKYFHIWNQHPRNCLNAKHEIKKMPTFSTENVLFGYFWMKRPYLGIFGKEL